MGRRSFIEVNKAVPRCFLSSLEDCLAAQGCAGVEILRQDLEKTTTKLHCAQACEVHLKAELACLKERWMLASLCAHIIIWMYKFDHWCVLNLWHQSALWCFYDLLRLERVSRQRADQSKTEELRGFKAEYDSSVAEMKKVRKLSLTGYIEEPFCSVVFDVHILYLCKAQPVRICIDASLCSCCSSERSFKGPSRLTAVRWREWGRRCQSWPRSCTSATSPSPHWTALHPASGSSSVVRWSERNRRQLSLK